MGKLKNLKVETESGVNLGSVVDCVWESESFAILQIKVKKGLFDSAPFLIHVRQIKLVMKDKIIVEDAVLSANSDLVNSGAEKNKILKSMPASGSLAQSANHFYEN